METTKLNFLSWNEVLKGDYQTVTVQSYGYTERSSFSSHFEPFARKRDFQFRIVRFDNRTDGYLEHNWLFLEESENKLDFELKDGKLYLDDPDLWTRPDY